MTIKTTKNIILTLVLLIPVLSYTQTGDDKFYNFNRDENGMVSSVEFIDKSTKKTINVFDVFENNPFKDLNYERIEDKRMIKYNLENVDPNQIFNEFLNNVTLEEEIKSKMKFTSAMVMYSVTQSNNYIIVMYKLNLSDGNDGLLAGVSCISFIMDSRGELFKRLPANNLGGYSPVITKDGKYMAYAYGAIMITGAHPEPGVAFYDVVNDKIIRKIESSEEYYTNPPFIVENVIIEVLNRGTNSIYLVFKPEDGVVYRKEYTIEQGRNLLRYENNGFVFKTPDGNERIDLYEVEFKKESF